MHCQSNAIPIMVIKVSGELDILGRHEEDALCGSKLCSLGHVQPEVMVHTWLCACVFV